MREFNEPGLLPLNDLSYLGNEIAKLPKGVRFGHRAILVSADQLRSLGVGEALDQLMARGYGVFEYTEADKLKGIRPITGLVKLERCLALMERMPNSRSS